MVKTYEALQMQRHISAVQEINAVFEMIHGRPPFAHIRTYGCQQNVSDGEKLKGMICEMGYSLTDRAEIADCILFNTCAVRGHAEDRVFGNVGALRHLKEKNPDLIIGVCGCMTQQAHVIEKIRKSYPYVSLAFGTHALPRLPELLLRVIEEKQRVLVLEEGSGEIVEDIPLRRDGTVKAWVPIMYGCDNFCSYCVVPYVRGRERSRDADAILQEIRTLVGQGYREFTLLGQNVNSWGKTLDQPMRFSRLLQQISAVDGDFRVRFMTSHPKDCTPELIDTIAGHRKLCSHIHLPVQSGSDRILKNMNRGYTAEHYLRLIDYARKTIPGVTFTSDILVGFPGETEADFQETLNLVKAVKYQSLFTFLYSRREGTSAAGLQDSATKEEKQERFQRLLDLQATIGMDQYAAQIGTIIEVLAEGQGKSGSGTVCGRTESNVIVEFEAPEDVIGSFLSVRITDAMQSALKGETVL